METRLDAPARPTSQAYQRAVTQFAAAAGLPYDELSRGDGFAYGDVTFWLTYYPADPEGVTVLADVCEVPDDPRLLVEMTGPILEYHATVPGVVHGVYGYTPATHRLVFCMRVGLDDVDDGGLAIQSAIANYLALRRDLVDVLQEPLPTELPGNLHTGVRAV